ncbi:hypothetical protein [Celerinatantimonas sp. YJH-8]|uniref:hypothetical protein n=1 Tax=Celerinatantimonas sp. YJH-8 TaxID=3228714 RepID=UPI0038C87C07
MKLLTLNSTVAMIARSFTATTAVSQMHRLAPDAVREIESMSKKLIRYGFFLIIALVICQIIKLAFYITLLTLAVLLIGTMIIRIQMRKFMNGRLGRYFKKTN